MGVFRGKILLPPKPSYYFNRGAKAPPNLTIIWVRERNLPNNPHFTYQLVALCTTYSILHKTFNERDLALTTDIYRHAVIHRCGLYVEYVLTPSGSSTTRL